MNDVMSAMHLVGKMPDGQPVYFAAEGKFDNPGLLVWNGKDHDRFVPGPKKDGAALRVEIENAINRHSAENGSDTPDFILAGFLMDALRAFDTATSAREKWYGRGPQPEMPLTDHQRRTAGQHRDSGYLSDDQIAQLRDAGVTEPEPIGAEPDVPLGFEDTGRPQVDRRAMDDPAAFNSSGRYDRFSPPLSPDARWDETNMRWIEPRK